MADISPDGLGKMSEKYRLMIYFAVATLHFYRNDIHPVIGLDVDRFVKLNEDLLVRIAQEGVNAYSYELSARQLACACAAYLSPSDSLLNNPAWEE